MMKCFEHRRRLSGTVYIYVQSMQQLPKRRVLATTTLRKFNKQWRIVCHHAQRIGSSPYTGDQVVSSSGDRKSPKGRPQQGRLGASVLRGNEIKATGEAYLQSVDLVTL